MHDSDETPDEHSVPLLDDVVDPDELEFLDTPKESNRPRIPDNQTILQVLREGIAAQISQELEPIVSSAVERAVDQVMEQARQSLLDELNGSLEKRIRLLIEAAVDQEFKKS